MGNLDDIIKNARQLGSLTEQLETSLSNVAKSFESVSLPLQELAKSLDSPIMKEFRDSIQDLQESLAKRFKPPVMPNLGANLPTPNQLANLGSTIPDFQGPTFQQTMPVHHLVKRVYRTQDADEANAHLAVGWVLLDTWEDQWMLGWPHDSEPQWPPGHCCCDGTKATNTTETAED